MIHRGDIYFVDLNPTKGREQSGKRPVLVLSNDIINKYYDGKLAAENAVEREQNKIERIDYEYSLNRLKNDYYNTISYNEKTGMSAADYYKILSECCKSPDKKPIDVKGSMDLKHNLCILGYNGESWFDVHPVVKELLKDKQLI